jgi:hypothetical protein
MKKSALFFGLALILIVLAWVGYAARGIYRPLPPVPAATPADAPRATSTAVANIGHSLEVSEPSPNSRVTSPLRISGRAQGMWFFDGKLAVQLLDAAGNLIAESAAEARPPAGGNRTAPEFTAFALTLEFQTPTTTPAGLLILRNHNPSGDPEQDIIFAIPVKFR